jgi:hypothetical protein
MVGLLYCARKEHDLMADLTTDPEGQAPEGLEPTEPTAPAVPASSDPDGQAPEGEEFDKDRALATIRKLRENEKQAARERKELEQLRAARKADEEAKLSEQERLSKRVAELEAERAKEREQMRDRTTRYEVRIAAQALNIVDPDAAVKLLNWDAIEYGDDGRPIDIEGALKALTEDKPYLVRQEPAQGQRSAGNPTNPTTRNAPTGTRRYTASQLNDRAFWTANKDDIMRAVREGRVDSD